MCLNITSFSVLEAHIHVFELYPFKTNYEKTLYKRNSFSSALLKLVERLDDIKDLVS